MNKRIVHVIGTGTIGEPLIGLLATFREQLGIDDVTFYKRTPLLRDRSKVLSLQKRGAKLAVEWSAWEKFKELGMEAAYETAEAIDQASVVIDCTPAGNENKEKYYNRYADNGRGFIAQGSEFGFGKMYARGINDKALDRSKDQFIQVVSCNTHNLAALIDTIALGPEKEDNLEKAIFICMRRANDLSEETEFLPSPEVGKHDDSRFGTHQARDAYHLFKTLGLDLNLFSSAMKLNTQYMHVIYFNLYLRKEVALDEVVRRLRANPRVALTHKMAASAVFSFGRDHGLYGRLLNQTVIPVRSLAVRDRRRVIGFSFTPQDGNSLLSSIAATEWFLYPEEYNDRLQSIENSFFQEV